MLVWSAQNRSISCEICPENDHKIRRLFTDCLPAKFTLKIPAKSTDFSTISSPKTREIWLFFRELSEALTKWGECLALKLQLFHKLIVISSEKLILSNLGLFSHVNPFCFLYHGLKTILVFISYQLNGSERISTMYLKTVIFRHSILDNSSIPLTPAKQRSIFYQNITDWRRISQCRTKLHCMVRQE